MKSDIHRDNHADVVGLRPTGSPPDAFVAQEVQFGLRDLAPTDRCDPELDRRRASVRLPAEPLG